MGGLSVEAKRKQVEQALEYAFDSAITEHPNDVMAFVISKLREWESEKERLKVNGTPLVRLLLVPGPNGTSKVQILSLPIPGLEQDDPSESC
ncbi:hypothetical protein AB1Y20_013148 [Prymnesium parvum]|uniref:Uncharacterized protein n=1 Tax=Prymnesium parvum TaxID=97485 RepID=A0AB34IMS9_PRYPA